MKLPVALDPPSAREARSRTRRPSAEHTAHLLGQDGRRRGLKGGPETLDAARTAYLTTEYSGDNDRRPQPGLIRREDI